MRIYLTLLFSLVSFVFLNAQTTKVAILDFENTSGKTEYDALGKSISSMLITDLANNIHPKKVEFFERSQLNRLLDEQKLQKSKNFDAKTAVDFGKLSGVDHVFVGSVFVLDGTCNFTSKLVNVQTSKIVIAKEVSGKIETWLQLKSQLAEAIASQLNNPIFLEPSYKDQSTSLVTINQYGKILTTMDAGDMDKAEQLRSVFQETTPNFKYFTDIKDEIERLKQRVTELENVTDILTDNFDLGDKAEMKKEFKSAIKYFEKFINNPGNQGYIENKKLYAYSKLARCQFLTGDYTNALNNSQKAQLIYKFFPEANETELMSLIKLEKNSDAESKYNFIIDSLIYKIELNFRRKEYNPALIWESIDGVYFGMLPQENSEDWKYLSIRNTGYGSSVENEVQIKKILTENSLSMPQSKNQLSQYEKIETKLLAFKDPLIFSSDQIINFYKLSFQYADDLNASGHKDRYKFHLIKEISRMENFGITCSSCDGMRIPLGPNEDKTKHKKWEEFNKVLWGLGLSNSLQEFSDNFHLIYGQFIYRYLITLLKDNQIEDAALIYKKISTTTVKDRDSYFYGYYWDIILGIRKINEDFNSRFNLSEIEFEKKIDDRIKNDSKKQGISNEIFNKVKSFNIKVNSGSLNVETDDKIVSNKSIWSKNLGIIEDGVGNKIELATEQNFFKFYEDSIPAYCFYDFDESNGEKFGKLYNFWALKLIAKNPPKGWRIANQKDFSILLGIDEMAKSNNVTNLDQILDRIVFEGIFDSFVASGQRHSNGFCCIDTQAWFWTSESSTDPKYHRVVDIYSSGSVRFTDFNCKECYFSIRLIKN